MGVRRTCYPCDWFDCCNAGVLLVKGKILRQNTRVAWPRLFNTDVADGHGVPGFQLAQRELENQLAGVRLILGNADHVVKGLILPRQPLGIFRAKALFGVVLVVAKLKALLRRGADVGGEVICFACRRLETRSHKQLDFPDFRVLQRSLGHLQRGGCFIAGHACRSVGVSPAADKPRRVIVQLVHKYCVPAAHIPGSLLHREIGETERIAPGLSQQQAQNQLAVCRPGRDLILNLVRSARIDAASIQRAIGGFPGPAVKADRVFRLRLLRP